MKQKIQKAFLLFIREIYLSLKNAWGLWVHPYRTLRVLRIEKDFSQIFLLFVAPVGFLVVFSSVFALIKLFFQPGGLVNQLLNFAFLAVFGFYCVVFAYLGYWLVYYLWVRKKAKNVT